MTSTKKRAFGIDIGGPLMNARGDYTPQGYAFAHATIGAFKALRELSDALATDPNRLHMISQCTPAIEAAKRPWLAEKSFVERTRITMYCVHFVREPREKGELCETLGLDTLVDDRPHILDLAKDHVPNLILFNPNLSELATFPELYDRALMVQGWEQLLPLLLNMID